MSRVKVGETYKWTYDGKTPQTCGVFKITGSAVVIGGQKIYHGEYCTSESKPSYKELYLFDANGKLFAHDHDDPTGVNWYLLVGSPHEIRGIFDDGSITNTWTELSKASHLIGSSASQFLVRSSGDNKTIKLMTKAQVQKLS